MKKVLIRSKRILKKQLIKLDNVSSVVVSNYAAMPTTFEFNGVTRFLAAFDTVPVAIFQITDNGNFFDCEINFNQTNNNIVLDYTQFPNKNC